MHAQIRPFPFALWSELAHRDPEGFESARLTMIEGLVASAAPEHQRRLKSLQWRLDQRRLRAADPRRACDALAAHLWERALGQDGLMARLTGLVDANQPGISASVLPFPRVRVASKSGQPPQ
ncbi:MAG: DUF3135 domain-containing protein [Gammaproteobacteria bacterium]|nr:DUF3135 domain-containing protein [Gammaproteobacteria bacterium]